MLEENDVFYTFDFEDRLEAMQKDLQKHDLGVKCQVIMKGNSRRLLDSYNWHLGNLIFEMRERHEAGIFDAVYLDGAHNFLHDGLAVCLLKELIKDNGFLILDDLFWSFTRSHSPQLLEQGQKFFPKEQAEAPQLLRVQELFLTTDSNFEKLSSPKDPRGVFRKRQR